MNTVSTSTLGDCLTCGVPLVRKPGGGRKPSYCSGTCRAAASNARARIDGRFEQWREVTNQRARVEERELVCPVCAGTFHARSASRRYCSQSCTNHAFSQRRQSTPEGRAYLKDRKRERRARIKGAAIVETFAAVEIYERDQWTCGLCAQPIDPTLAHPDLMSASLDHIVPLAKGGDHSRANVQAAHFLCNSIKGDRA